jgi:hypothetical protein
VLPEPETVLSDGEDDAICMKRLHETWKTSPNYFQESYLLLHEFFHVRAYVDGISVRLSYERKGSGILFTRDEALDFVASKKFERRDQLKSMSYSDLYESTILKELGGILSPCSFDTLDPMAMEVMNPSAQGYYENLKAIYAFAKDIEPGKSGS